MNSKTNFLNLTVKQVGESRKLNWDYFYSEKPILEFIMAFQPIRSNKFASVTVLGIISPFWFNLSVFPTNESSITLCVACDSNTDKFHPFHPFYQATKYRVHLVWLFLLLNSREPCVTIPIVTNKVVRPGQRRSIFKKYERQLNAKRR